MKICLVCGELLALDRFYKAPTTKQVHSYCKSCHNARCTARRKSNPDYKARQQAAKRRWERERPWKKRRYEGRMVFTGRGPLVLLEMERLVWALSEPA